MPCAKDSALMGETIEEQKNNLRKWKEAFVSKDLNVNLGKTNIIVKEGITRFFYGTFVTGILKRFVHLHIHIHAYINRQFCIIVIIFYKGFG